MFYYWSIYALYSVYTIYTSDYQSVLFSNEVPHDWECFVLRVEVPEDGVHLVLGEELPVAGGIAGIEATPALLEHVAPVAKVKILPAAVLKAVLEDK